jgi:putative flippase GtrA
MVRGMSVVPITRNQSPGARTSPDVEIVVPVYNEAEQLARSITALRTYLDTSFPFVATITIADNASTDRTWPIAMELASTMDGVEAIHLDQKGRGRALRAAWSRSSASVVAYMDVDLATGLDALLPLVAPLLSGHSDVAIGTRLGPGAHVVRGARREMISRGYNLLLRSALRSPCTDAQCGFKALRREAAAEVLPLVEDDEWFFDTEVLVTAQRVGLRIHEVPVDWVDDTDSRVEVLHTALDDLRGVWRMLGRRPVSRVAPGPGPSMSRPVRTPSSNATSGRVSGGRETGGSEAGGRSSAGRSNLTAIGPSRTEPTGVRGDTEVFADELLRFAGVGAISTVAYAGAFAALEPSLGGYLANAVAIIGCSMGNTAAHRGMAGNPGVGLDRSQRMATTAALTGVSLAFTTGALAVTRAVGLRSLVPELFAVTAGNAAASVIRFAILRNWVFRPQFGTHLATGSGAFGTGATRPISPTAPRPS